jgi:hypothetical protein
LATLDPIFQRHKLDPLKKSTTHFNDNTILEALITSKTRVKLLLKFFLNPDNCAHLRGLETEFGESSNSIRLELNRLEKANLLHSSLDGNKRLFQVNQQHPLYNEINSIVRKFIGLDIVVENIAKRLGNLHAVYLTGEIVKGKDNEILDLIFVGDIDQAFLITCIEKAEGFIKRKVRYLIYPIDVFEKKKNNGTMLLIWQK